MPVFVAVDRSQKSPSSTKDSTAPTAALNVSVARMIGTGPNLECKKICPRFGHKRLDARQELPMPPRPTKIDSPPGFTPEGGKR